MIAIVLLAVTGFSYWRWRRKLGRESAELVASTPIRGASLLATLPFHEAVRDNPWLSLNKVAGKALILRYLPDATNIVNLAAEVGRNGDFAVHFSAAGIGGMKSGVYKLMMTADGTTLPVTRDVATGKLVEIGRIGPAALSAVAQIGSIVVSAAHIISGMDVVSKSADLHSDVRLIKDLIVQKHRSELETLWLRVA
ncbi:MAG TPA: hypothetical protein VN515_05855 [Terriglobales bacterium]|nr:hypothetical protein [Terriglobales bacterium]